MTIGEWISHLGRPLLRLGMALLCPVAPLLPSISESELLTIYGFVGLLYGLRGHEKIKMAETK